MAERSASTTSMSYSKRCFPFGFRDEALTLVKITVPFAMGNVLSSWLISFISLAFMGHAHGQLELNACALALSTYVLIANSLMLGLNFGCDTLLPQCFGGNKRKMGLTIQRAVLITGYSCLLSWALLLNAVNNYSKLKIYFKLIFLIYQIHFYFSYFDRSMS
jgi:Na+-driven multidrug efflux pump